MEIYKLARNTYMKILCKDNSNTAPLVSSADGEQIKLLEFACLSVWFSDQGISGVRSLGLLLTMKFGTNASDRESDQL